MAEERPRAREQAVLVVLDGPNAGAELLLGDQTVRIGRLMSCELRLGDPKLGRVHGRVEPRDGAYVYRDMGSTYGTSVAGQRVHEHVLADGDTLLLGDTRVGFRIAKPG